MKLYFAPGACSLSPHIVLREAGLQFELEKVDLATKKTESGADYTTISPKGYVPALVLDDGQLLTEGPAIVQYIADRNPDMGLAPAVGTMERYRLEEWLVFVSSELHKTFNPLWSPTTPEAYKPIVHDNLARRFDFLERHLEKQEYLMGARFTVADAYCFTILNWSNLLEVDLARWPNLRTYIGRVAGRPKVQEAMKAEGLVK